MIGAPRLAVRVNADRTLDVRNLDPIMLKVGEVAIFQMLGTEPAPDTGRVNHQGAMTLGPVGAALLALAHQYANECGDCAGARVTPDDEPCEACADIWTVIDKAEGRA